MIQFNLLPDVKMEYMKARRMKRLVTVVSLISAAVSLSVLTLMFVTVQIAQKKHLKDVSKDITTQMNQLKGVPDLDKILTVQNQLNSLPDLHNKKPITSRLFNYIQQVTPVQVNISSLTVDFTANTMQFTGTADTLATINKFADTMKFATFTTTDNTTPAKPFSSVVTTLTGGDKKATYSIDCSFDPLLFANTNAPVLTVPKITSTRSETEKPAAVFKSDVPAPTTVKPGAN